jgi:hypothetical protein
MFVPDGVDRSASNPKPFTPEIRAPIFVEYEAGWAVKQVWTL